MPSPPSPPPRPRPSSDALNSEGTEPGPSQTIRASIQPLLPTCMRCRRLRRKCDTQLPSCRLCQKAEEECLFYDHALKQPLPRAYVESLLVRLDQLQAVKHGIQVQPEMAPSSSTASGYGASVLDLDAQDTGTRAATSPKIRPLSSNRSVGNMASFHDLVIPSRSTVGKSRFWGSSSVFALAAEVIQHAHAKGLISAQDTHIHPDADSDKGEGQGDPDGRDDRNESQADTWTGDNAPFYRILSPASAADVEALVALYMTSLNTLYGIVDAHTLPHDTTVYLSMRSQPDFSPRQVRGRKAHSHFRISMMCACACAVHARYRPSRVAESLAYYGEAIACVEAVTSEASPRSLQALLLLIVFFLFYPRRGDVWKLLDYACRLAVELGYHTEQQLHEEETEVDQELEHDQEAEPSSSSATHDAGDAPDRGSTSSAVGEEDQDPEEGAARRRKLRRSTFWGLYAIERIVGQLFGRGTDLPESIIQTEYPSALATDSSGSMGTDGSMDGIDQAALQPMSIAHHYRLVYLRSEIFRTMYLPSRPPDETMTLPWLREKYDALHAWRRELAVEERLVGVATITCDVGYDATICFLFQPLLLRAVRRAAYDNPMPEQLQAKEGRGGGPESESTTGVIAADGFYSACNLIQTYKKVVRAPEGSVLGTYPMTFMSAHYIWIASSTLLAHALLALDGRTRMLPRFSKSETREEVDSTGTAAERGCGSSRGSKIDLGTFVDISGSCLMLLSWCVERWPEMGGMMEVQRKLFTRVIRELIRRG